MNKQKCFWKIWNSNFKNFFVPLISGSFFGSVWDRNLVWFSSSLDSAWELSLKYHFNIHSLFFLVFLWCLLYLKLTILNLFWFEDDLKWMIHYLILDSDWVDHSGFRHLPFAFFGIWHDGFWTRLELELLASSCKEPIAHESLHLDTKKGLISGENGSNRVKNGSNRVKKWVKSGKNG